MKPLQIGLVSGVVIGAGLALYQLWWFGHPAPCLPDTPHCALEFTSSTSFRVLSLFASGVVALISGIASMAVSAVVIKLRTGGGER